MNKESRVVVWAIDPFETETCLDEPLLHRLKRWVQASGFELQPVYISSIPRGEKDLAAAEKALFEYCLSSRIE